MKKSIIDPKLTLKRQTVMLLKNASLKLAAGGGNDATKDCNGIILNGTICW